MFGVILICSLARTSSGDREQSSTFCIAEVAISRFVRLQTIRDLIKKTIFEVITLL